MIDIRKYTSNDWEALQKIHDPARMQELHAAGLDDAFLPLYVAAEREDLFDYQVYVALLDGQTVGFTAFTEDELAWLYVHPDYQRKGVGKALATFALERMSSETKMVEVLWGNEPARNLYRSLGFTQEVLLHGKMPGNEKFAVSAWQMTMPQEVSV